MNRRGFLTSLFGAAALPILDPFKGTAFSFLGGIYRPRPRIGEGLLTISEVARELGFPTQDIANYLSVYNPILGDIKWWHDDYVETELVGVAPRYSDSPCA